MPEFIYSALNVHGQTIKGHIQAETSKNARVMLKNKGLMVLEIQKDQAAHKTKPVAIKGIETKKPWYQSLFKRHIKTNDLILFSQQLATLVSSGIPISEALSLIEQQADSSTLERVCASAVGALGEGKSFSQSLETSPFIFPTEFIATISAAEESGHMSEVLSRLADEVETQGQSSQKLKGALIYPVVMIVVSLSIVVLMMIYVVPQIAGAFSTTGQSLPFMTRSMMFLSDFVINYGWYALMVIVATLTFYLRMYTSSAQFRKKAQRFFLRLPFFGKLIRLNEIARWSRTLSLLLKSGIPSLQALYIASQVVGNLHLKDLFSDVCERVREGQSLADSLKEAGHVPSFAVYMCQSGESSGNLDFMMKKVSDYYENFLQTQISVFLKLFEPALVLSMGTMVLTIVLSVLLPIFQINQLV